MLSTYNKITYPCVKPLKIESTCTKRSKSKSKTHPSLTFSNYVLCDLFGINWYRKNHTYFAICLKVKGGFSKIKCHRVYCLGRQQSNYELLVSDMGRNHGKSWKISSRPMPFPMPRLFLMPSGWTMPFSAKLPAHHNSGLKKVWHIRGYALWHVWSEAGLTVLFFH